MKTISFLSLLLLFSACLLPAEERHKLIPAGAPYSFTAAPDREHAYTFTAPKLPDGGECRWNLTNLDGRELQQGSLSVTQGRGEVKLTLPAGYYLLHFPEQEQIFGLSVLSPFDGVPDPYFAIEALLEGTSPEFMENCLKLLHRGGIRFNREWTQFHSLNPAEGVTSDRNDRLYRESGALGIGSIFAFHDFPAWLDGFGASTRKNLPGKLVELDSALERMLTARRDGLEGFQILNEYDLQE